MSSSKLALLGACCVVMAMVGCDGPRVEVDAGRDAGTTPMMDAGEDDAGSPTPDAGRDTGTPPGDAGGDDGATTEDAATTDDAATTEDAGSDASDPDACVPVACGATECGVDVRDDGCGTLLNCGLCGIGGGCNDDAGCTAGNECITEAETGWTDGYCSRECRVNADCTASSHCAFRDPLTLIGTCVRNCTTDADCRAGYACRDEDEDTAASLECVPTGSGTGTVGDACAAHGDCGGGADGFCLIEPNGWHEGYCSQTCSLATPCPTGSHCGFFDSTTGQGVCLLNCTGDTDCRADGYLCFNGDGDTLPIDECFPAATGTGLPGEACTGAWDCGGGQFGACFDEDGDFRGGYCTRGCASASDCPSGSHCSAFATSTGTTRICTPNCVDDAGCRSDGYACYDVNGDGTTECWSAGTGTSPIGGACAGVWECAGRDRSVCLRRPDFDFADGYCTFFGCTDTGTDACPVGSHCSADSFTSGGAPFPICLDDCSTTTDPCRSPGYGCYDNYDTDTTAECWPSATGAAAPGEPCRWITDCAGGENGYCALDGTFGRDWPGGYCVQFCETMACPSGSFCFSSAICLRSCTSDSSCRVDDDYICATLTSGDMACL